MKNINSKIEKTEYSLQTTVAWEIAIADKECFKNSLDFLLP